MFSTVVNIIDGRNNFGAISFWIMLIKVKRGVFGGDALNASTWNNQIVKIFRISSELVGTYKGKSDFQVAIEI